jgi:hypothetical protein
MFTVQVFDYSDSIYLSFIGNEVGDVFMGITAEKFEKL